MISEECALRLVQRLCELDRFPKTKTLQKLIAHALTGSHTLAIASGVIDKIMESERVCPLASIMRARVADANNKTQQEVSDECPRCYSTGHFFDWHGLKRRWCNCQTAIELRERNPGAVDEINRQREQIEKEQRSSSAFNRRMNLSRGSGV